MKTPMRALLVEDNPGDADLVRASLVGAVNVELVCAQNLAEAVSLLRAAPPDAVLLDLNLPDSVGLATLARVMSVAPDSAVVVFTGSRDEELGVSATRHGAQDYLVKGRVPYDAVWRLLHLAVERKRIERDLRHSQQRLQLALESMRIGVWDLDITTDKSLRNLLHDQIFGYQVAQPRWGLGEFLAHVVTPTTTVVRAELERGLMLAAFQLECEIRRADGKSRWIELDARVYHEGNVPRRLLAVITDVTERRLSEKALQEARERFAKAFNMNPAAMVITSTDTGVVLDCNDSLLRLCGLRREDAIGRGVEALHVFSAAERSRMLAMSEASGFVGLLVSGEAAGRGPRQFWWLAQTVSINGSLCRLEILSDVTESRRAEQREQELQRVRQVEQFKSDFLRDMSHELNSPMTPAKIQVHLLRTGALGDLNDSQDHAIDILDRNLQRLSRMTGDMLDVARLQARNLPLRWGQGNLEDVARNSFQALSPMVKEKQLQCEIVAAAACGQFDQARIEQVIVNLLSNAVKATPHGGHIKLVIEERPTELECRVVDDGVGLPEDKAATLFRPFHQINPQIGIGVGLGLYISRGIVEAHGGRMWCASAGPGKGATFAFAIPKRPARADPSPVAVAQEANHGQGAE